MYHGHGQEPPPPISNEAATRLSEEAVEQILNGLLMHHQADYAMERENLELKEKLDTIFRQNSVSRHRYMRDGTPSRKTAPMMRKYGSYKGPQNFADSIPSSACSSVRAAPGETTVLPSSPSTRTPRNDIRTLKSRGVRVAAGTVV